MSSPDAFIVGAGPGGLAVAAAMAGRGLHGVVLDRSDAIGSSWRAHYDRLHLHTPRRLSGLPGFPIPREMGRWVSRDDVVRYLELYAAHHRLDVRLGTSVERIDRAVVGDGGSPGWTLSLGDGSSVTAPFAVVATGFNNTPKQPNFPGIEGFSGEMVVARDYRNGAPWAGRDVLVVGTGNTGTELAVDLAEHGAARVRLAVRTPPHIVRRNTGPIAAQHTGIAVRHLPIRVADRLGAIAGRLQTPDLSRYGLARPTTGIASRVVQDNAIPVQDVGIIDAIRSGAVEPVAAVDSFAGNEVRLTDGSVVRPDMVLLALGYDQGLEPLVGHLGVLNEKGHPVETGGRAARGAKGLYYTGFTNPISGMLRELRIDAQKIAIAMNLERARRREGSN